MLASMTSSLYLYLRSPLYTANSGLSTKACMAHLAAALPSASALSTLGLNGTGMTADAGKV